MTSEIQKSAVSVGIVTWNSASMLYDCLNAVFASDYRPLDVWVYDNASADDTRQIASQFSGVKIIKSEENIGFGAGHNEILRRSNAPYYLCLNPDAVLEPDAINEMVKTIKKYEKAAAVGGKIKRTQDGKQTNVIDSVGLSFFQHFQATDQGSGSIDDGQFGAEAERFGISGACVLYDKQKLQQIAHHFKGRSEFFDEAFFAYKEDVDLAYRIRAAGYQSWYTPEAVVYHARTARETGKSRFGKILGRMFEKPDHINRLSYRNQRLLLLKHLRRHQDPMIQIKTWWYQLQIFAYLLIFETETLLEWGEVLKRWRNIRRKARQMPYSVDPSEIEAWME